MRASSLTISASGGEIVKIFPPQCDYVICADDVSVELEYTAVLGIQVYCHSEPIPCVKDILLRSGRIKPAREDSQDRFHASEDSDLIRSQCMTGGLQIQHVAGVMSWKARLEDFSWDMKTDVERNARSCGLRVSWVPPAFSLLIRGVIDEAPLGMRSTSLDESTRGVCGETRDAFNKLLHFYLGTFLAAVEPIENVDDCAHVCLREACDSSLWTVRSLAEVWLLSTAQSPISRLLRSPEPRDFIHFGEVLGLAYRGPSLHTSGLDGIGTFQSTPTCLPQMPWGKTVLERPTEWAYAETENSGDMIEASVSNLFANIAAIFLEGSFLQIPEKICDVVSMMTYWASARKLLMDILRRRDDAENQRVNLETQASTLRGVVLYQDSFGVACVEHFRTSAASALRRRREFASTTYIFAQAAARRTYDDYVTIGRLSNSEYCGCLPGRVEDSTASAPSPEVLAKVQPHGVPPSVWVSSAVFRRSTVGDNRQPDYHVTSFYGIHRQIQRQQPTFASLLAAVRLIETQGQSVSLEALGRYFPSVPDPLLRQLWEMDVEARTACKQNEAFLNELHEDTCERRPVPARRRQRGKVPRSLTEQSLLLREENRRFELDELSRLHPCFDRSRSRVSEPLSRQPLGPKARFGLEIGARRGLLCLQNDYCDLLVRKDKDLRKSSVNADGSPGVSMDVDLELRNEVLPLSPWLLEKMKGLSHSEQNGDAVTEASRVPTIMACLNDPNYQHELLERIRAASALLERVVELTQNSDDLASVHDAQEGLQASSSRHEICIGVAHMYLTSLVDT